MGYGGGPVAVNPLVQDGFRLHLPDMTGGKPLRPHAHFRGRLSWSRWGEEQASVQFDLTTDAISGRLCLVYDAMVRATGERVSMDYVIGLVTTEQPAGGVRFWFWCDRGRAMCSTLYMLPGSFVFASRRAFTRPLSYRTQRVSVRDRHLEKAQAIRESLGGSVSVFDEFPDKPPRMWWSTYAKKRAKAEAAAGVSLALLSQQLDLSGFRDQARRSLGK